MTHTHISHIEHPPGVKNRAIYRITDQGAYLASVTIEGVTHNRFTFLTLYGREWLERLEDQVWAWWIEEGRDDAMEYEREIM